MHYFLIAGEASGDLHAANLMKALKDIDADARFTFLGGDLMAKQGGTQVKDYREMAFMGIVNVVANLGKVMRNFSDCEEALRKANPDVLILIDYPSFNLRVAKWVKKHMDIPVYFYIAPKLWAWKSWRIKAIRRYIDEMFTIFPFETEYFASKGYTVNYVGNPTVDAVEAYRHQRTFVPASQPTIAILAGSRRQEIKGCLSTMIAAAKAFPDHKIVVTTAPSIDQSFYTSIIGNDPTITLTSNTYEAVEQAHVAVVNSGTATLETALLGTPQVVVYHVVGGRFASLLRKILIKIPYVSLVNLIGGKEVARELIAHEFTQTNIERELHRLLDNDSTYRQQKEDYAKIAHRLGGEGTAKRAAKVLTEKLSLYKTEK
ncbi:MAG: lipid-A-disaccharide synthase [Paludibacteraceae bacterium]|nr:lipid-A-disaccharide synthase [Paludibacteraceae bacterium]